MTKYILNISLLVALVFLGACQKDKQEFIPGVSENISGNDIFGVVLDEANIGIEGAKVVFDGQTKFTDAFGIYQFKDVVLNTKHNFLSINKDGYFEGARTFRTIKKTNINHTTQLLPKNFTNNFDGGSGGAVEQGNIKLEFPAGSVVVESTGDDYDGTVRVAIQYLDPTNDNIIRRMPGDMSATNAEDIFSTLTSFGMAYVEMQSTTGQKLQIKDGMKATMTGQIPTEISSDAPQTIKMWVFDDATGLWKEEGSAQRVGNTYVGEVAHFSCWNYDGSAETIIACGRILDQKGNGVGGVHVWIATPAFFAVGHGNTNPDGTFCGAVTKGEILTLEIRGIDGCDEPVFLGEIGPFDMDVDLGDITIVIDDAVNIQISGTAINCDGGPLTNGVLIFHNHHLQITDGTFEASIIQCDPSQDFKARVVDLDALKESEEIIVTGVGPHMLGEVDACGDEIFIMTMNIDDLDIHFEGLLELFASENSDSTGTQTLKSLFGFYQGGNPNGKGSGIHMQYDDLESMGFATGPFPLTYLNFNQWSQGNEDSYDLVNGEVTITQYNEANMFLKGNYTALVKSKSTDLEYTLYGKFKLNTP